VAVKESWVTQSKANASAPQQQIATGVHLTGQGSGAGGDLAPTDALADITKALKALKSRAILPLLNAAVTELKQHRPDDGAQLALQALNIDDSSAQAWQVLAVCREQSGDLTGALQCYSAAHKLNPENDDLAYNLGHLACRMGHAEIGEKLFRHFLARRPDSADAANNLACALRSQMRFAEATNVIRDAINRAPHLPLLWNTVATILLEQGEMEKALIFFGEAIRLDPQFGKAYYNRSVARRDLGDCMGAIEDCEAAIALSTVAYETAVMRFALALLQISVGDLASGWNTYEVRFDPIHPNVVFFATERPVWTLDAEVQGKTILVFGEQGLGDEIVFANTLPDLIADIGSEGRVILAVEPRLVSLFQRSFPQIEVGPHDTGKVDHYDVRLARFVGDGAHIDLWVPIGSLLRKYRAKIDAFPDTAGFLKADPDRVAHWRRELAAISSNPKIGLLWKSLKNDAGRQRFYSAFDDWAPVLTRPNLTFINLQYGDCAAEIADAEARFGVEIWNPPFDLRRDLDEVAALACALDLTIGPSNATTNIVGACGAPLWLLQPPGAWPQLGTDRYPWYPQARVFIAPSMTRWAETLQTVAEALGAEFPEVD